MDRYEKVRKIQKIYERAEELIISGRVNMLYECYVELFDLLAQNMRSVLYREFSYRKTPYTHESMYRMMCGIGRAT